MDVSRRCLVERLFSLLWTFVLFKKRTAEEVRPGPKAVDIYSEASDWSHGPFFQGRSVWGRFRGFGG